MKLFLCIGSRNDEILDISGTLKRIGYDVRTFFSDSYRSQCTYVEKKLDKLGWRKNSLHYKADWKREILNGLKFQKPDKIIFVNTINDLLSVDEVREIREECLRNNIKMLVWLVDAINGQNDVIEHCRCFDKVATYENADVELLAKNGINAKYLPVGYQPVYEMENDEETSGKIDVCFIGSPYKNRLEILEKISKVATIKQWKVKIAGPFWPKNHIWKKYIFKWKYPSIYRYVENGDMSSNEVARLYRMAKVCLNIHARGAQGLNPRAFEIMAACSLQIVDVRGYYDKINPEEDLVVYNSIEELIKKLDFYIQHETERKQIALNGHEKALRFYSMEASLNKLLTNCW